MKLCVFQGTFNPVHNAHLRVADYVAKTYDFDKFLFIPAFKPPHKNCDDIAPEDRLNMVKLGVGTRRGFEVSDIEYLRKGKSYTYLTIKELYEKYKPEGKIGFIIGTDAFRHIETWYETDKLKESVKFIVFIREDEFDKENYEHLRAKGYDFEILTLPYKDISSTEIRRLVRSGEDISEYTPKEVKEYIYEHGLYKNE